MKKDIEKIRECFQSDYIGPRGRLSDLNVFYCHFEARKLDSNIGTASRERTLAIGRDILSTISLVRVSQLASTAGETIAEGSTG